MEVDSYVERQTIPEQRLEIVLEDGRRIDAEIYEHHDYLYILENIGAGDSAEGLDIHGSLQLLDSEGNVPIYVDDERTFPEYMTMTGDGTGAAGRDLGALIRGEGATP